MAGMTLVEVMVALLISTVGLLGALALVGVSTQGAAFSRAATEASVLAQSKLEAEVARVGVTMSSPANATTTEASLDALGTASATGAYTRATTWGASTDGLRRRVTVDVSWLDSLGRSHTITASRERAP